MLCRLYIFVFDYNMRVRAMHISSTPGRIVTRLTGWPGPVDGTYPIRPRVYFYARVPAAILPLEHSRWDILVPTDLCRDKVEKTLLLIIIFDNLIPYLSAPAERNCIQKECLRHSTVWAIPQSNKRQRIRKSFEVNRITTRSTKVPSWSLIGTLWRRDQRGTRVRQVLIQHTTT